MHGRAALSLPLILQDTEWCTSSLGLDRFTEPHALKALDLPQGAIKGAFVLFSTTLLGLVGFVLQITLLLPHEPVW